VTTGETPITVIGNLTDDPELTFTTSGAAWCRFVVASTPRSFDKTTNKWSDGTGMFLRCSAWRDLAEHAAESLTKGTRVIVVGRLRQNNWTTQEGEKRSALVVEVDSIGPDLRFVNAKLTKAERGGTKASGFDHSDDPWTSATPASVSAASPGFGDDQPPF
jgi:single-strand DNA-binding protein